MINDLVHGIRQLFYPAVCVVCNTPLGDVPNTFCATCRFALATDPYPTCPRCSGTIAEHADISEGCAHCRNETYHFEAATRLAPYEGLVREVILRMKHRPGELLAECMGHLWAEAQEARLRSLNVDTVIPIPLHWWRRWKRGFNQSEYLSAALAKRLGLAHQPKWLRRIRATPSQTTLTPAQRRTNVKNAFGVSHYAQLKDRSVLLIDDVFTTGSTLSEAAKVLKAAGAKRVCVAALAHP